MRAGASHWWVVPVGEVQIRLPGGWVGSVERSTFQPASCLARWWFGQSAPMLHSQVPPRGWGTRWSSSLVAAYEFAKARITGEKPFLGENRKKTVAMG